MNTEECTTIAIGDTITYTLSADPRSRTSQREERGVVNRITPDVQMVFVTLLDEEYEALNEPVRMSQITSVTKTGRAYRKQCGQTSGERDGNVLRMPCLRWQR